MCLTMFMLSAQVETTAAHLGGEDVSPPVYIPLPIILRFNSLVGCSYIPMTLYLGLPFLQGQ